MNHSQLLLYQTEDGQTKIDIRLEEGIDASLPNLRLSNFKGKLPTKQETEIAKN